MTAFNKVSWLSYRTLIAFMLTGVLVNAQFAGPVDSANTSAVLNDSSIIAAWASSCELRLGLADTADDSFGYPVVGNENSALGVPDGLDVVSLGDGGSATLTFGGAFSNGDGPDIIVFENSFSSSFLELAFVEASSDGVNFVRFPAISNTQTNAQVGPFDTLNTSALHNLAGKYPANYGTPFDLEDLMDSSLIDIYNVTHVRIVDVVGSIDPVYGSRDSEGKLINDPYPTPFTSAGFDLDAVAVCHITTKAIDVPKSSVVLYPNPSSGHVAFSRPVSEISIWSVEGVQIASYGGEYSSINLQSLPKGQYIFRYNYDQSIKYERLVLQ